MNKARLQQALKDLKTSTETLESLKAASKNLHEENRDGLNELFPNLVNELKEMTARKDFSGLKKKIRDMDEELKEKLKGDKDK